MFDIGLPELMIILLLGLVLLGPDRLPGVIREVTGVVRKLRSSYGDALATFKDQLGDVQGDIDAIRGEISSIQGEFRSTAEDVQKDVEKVEGEVKSAGVEIQRDLDKTTKEAAGTRPDQIGAETSAPPLAVTTETSPRPNLSDRGAAWTPQGAQAGSGSPVQQDLFAGLIRSLKVRLGDDWLVEQAEIYRDLGTRAAQRNGSARQDIAALVRTWADMHRNTLPDGSLQIIETGRDYRVRMRQCPFGFADTDDKALCQSCGAYDLAFLQERAAEVKWESHLTAGDPWCELVFAKPPPPPKPEPANDEVEAEPAATANGDNAVASTVSAPFRHRSKKRKVARPTLPLPADLSSSLSHRHLARLQRMWASRKPQPRIRRAMGRKQKRCREIAPTTQPFRRPLRNRRLLKLRRMVTRLTKSAPARKRLPHEGGDLRAGAAAKQRLPSVRRAQ